MKGLAFLLLTAFLLGCEQGSPEREITVTGEATLYVPPDKAVFSFGAYTEDLDLLKAKEENNAVISAALDFLKKGGVEGRYIRTEDLRITLLYDDYTTRQIRGYSVRNAVTVTVMDLDKVEDFITGILALGINQIDAVNFQTSQLQEHQDRARETALKNATEKAQRMTATMGLSLGLPLSIQELSSGMEYSRGVMALMAEAPRGGPEATETLAYGQIAVRASVAVRYGLKN